MQCRIGMLPSVDGSAMYEQGNTVAVAVVHGPRSVVRRSKAQHDRAVINCEYSMAPFSTSERKKRRAGDRRHAEMGLALKQTFEVAVMTTLYKRSEIDIHVQILQSDGGELSAAINAVTLALIDAGIAMRDMVAACNAGYLDKTPLLDLNYREKSGGGPVLPVALMPKTDKVSLVQMDSRLPLQVYEAVLKLAVTGCRQVYEIMQGAVKERTLKLLASRGAPTL